VTSAGLLVTRVSKYLSLTLSTNTGSAIRMPNINTKVSKAVQGLVKIFFNMTYLSKKNGQWPFKCVAGLIPYSCCVSCIFTSVAIENYIRICSGANVE
jgi:hypothetical protein